MNRSFEFRRNADEILIGGNDGDPCGQVPRRGKVETLMLKRERLFVYSAKQESPFSRPARVRVYLASRSKIKALKSRSNDPDS